MENTTVDYSWQKNAPCKNIPTKMFYPGSGQKIDPRVVAACSSCPEAETCLDHALKYEKFGVWANTIPKDRSKLRKERGIVLQEIDCLSNQAYEEEVVRHQDFVQSLKIKGRGRKPAKCGTRSGYNAHLRRKEKTCSLCREALNQDVKGFNDKKANSVLRSNLNLNNERSQ